jgi:hypothetical protein
MGPRISASFVLSLACYASIIYNRKLGVAGPLDKENKTVNELRHELRSRMSHIYQWSMRGTVIVSIAKQRGRSTRSTGEQK